MSRHDRSLAVAVTLALAACGPPSSVPEIVPSTPAPAGPSGTVPASPERTIPTGDAALEAVYAAVEGLTGEERRAKLIELADAEGNQVTVYTSTNLDESEPLVSAFEEATGVEVNLYRASASTVIQRVTQEAAADFQGGADIIAINGPEMTILDAEGLLARLTTPVTDTVLPEGVFDTWSAMYLNVFIAAWNTDRIAPAAAPTSHADLFTEHRGTLGMELGDWDWFATLVKSFVAEGMTEDEAVQMFKDAASGARVVDGHTLMTELLAAGEFDITASNYQHRVFQLIGEGAPIAWEPAVEPIVVRPNGIGIRSGAERPAGALLYLEYVLGEGQDLFLALERTPASTEALGGLQGEFRILFADVQALLDEAEKWEGLYEEVVAESGQIIEE